MNSVLIRKAFTLALALPIVQLSFAQNSWAASNLANSPNYNVKQAHGVWDRTNHYEFDEAQDKCVKSDKVRADQSIFKGFRVSPKWKDFEPEQGVFRWCLLDEAIKEAAATNKYIYFQLLIGPDSPRWLYEEKGIPEVFMEDGGTRDSKEPKTYPFYAHNVDSESSDGYKDYVNNTVTAIAEHISTKFSQNEAKRILFIQVATGSTGDETPYKGTPTNPDYALEDKGDLECQEGWCKYRMAVFKSYVEAFQPKSGELQIPLLFNVIDKEDYPKENRYVKNNVKYLGQKGGVLPRGYNLNGMVNNINEVRPYAIDPQKGFILSRAEMDQTWKNPYFQLNLPMNMYWSVLNALHGGLGIFDISKDLLNPAENPQAGEVEEILQFFNKYAGEIDPETSQGAFIAFQKGLDATDKEAYPIKDFCTKVDEDCKKQDKNRFRNIVKHYKNYGAQMDDLDGAMVGQVKQRKILTGFNDSGVEIPSGNYERFITQIKPDKNDVGLWRIGGELTKQSPKESRFARGFWTEDGKNRIDLDVNDKFYRLRGDTKPTEIKVKVTYFDEGTGQFSIKYDSVEDSEKLAETVTKKNTLTWQTKTVTLTDAAFRNRDGDSRDISPDISLINESETENSTFHMVEIRKVD